MSTQAPQWPRRRHKMAIEAVGTALLAFTVAISGNPIAVGCTLMCVIYGAS